VTIAASREHEYRAGSTDVESRASNGARAEGTAQHLSKLVSTDDRAGNRAVFSGLALNCDSLGAAGAIAADNL
jgi:hypothetical protein